MRTWIRDYIEKQMAALNAIGEWKVEEAIRMVNACRKRGGRIFIAGNGGSMCNATHFHVDLVKGANKAVWRDGHPPYFAASALDSAPLITAISNDIEPEECFASHMDFGDTASSLLIAVSVSGKSPNIVRAVSAANLSGTKVLLLSGNLGAPPSHSPYVPGSIDLHIEINDTHYGRVEDAQMTILHMICYAFMEQTKEACGL